MPQRAYKFRGYPTGPQQRRLRQYFGAGRWVWNQCLAWRRHLYQALGESVSAVDFSRELTALKPLEPYQWLRQVPATVLAQSLRDQDAAFRHFFAARARYPRFKSRHRRQSIRFPLDPRVVAGYYRAGERLKLPGLGVLAVRWSRRPKGIPKRVTVSGDTAGRYFVSMAIEEAIPELAPAPSGSVGLDLGTTPLAILSTGEKLAHPRALARYREPLRKLQQRLARQRKGSRRRACTRQRIARLHARMADTRREHLHRLSTRLVRETEVIVVEDLNAEGMGRSARGTREEPGRNVRQKAGLNRSLKDAAFGERVRPLAYQAAWYGRALIRVERFYPSSKTCSACGHRLDELRLGVREWTCPKCGTAHDRDINAARNLEAEGLRILEPTPGGAGEVRAPGGEGACPVAVSARSPLRPSTCLEQG